MRGVNKLYIKYMCVYVCVCVWGGGGGGGGISPTLIVKKLLQMTLDIIE